MQAESGVALATSLRVDRVIEPRGWECRPLAEMSLTAQSASFPHFGHSDCLVLRLRSRPPKAVAVDSIAPVTGTRLLLKSCGWE